VSLLSRALIPGDNYLAQPHLQVLDSQCYRLLSAKQAFTADENYAASKIAIFIASILAARVGSALLWRKPIKSND